MTAILAHGVGGRSDLPIPVWMAAWAGAIVLIVSFVGLAAFWTTARFHGATAGDPMARGVQRLADSSVLRGLCAAVGVAMYAVTVAALLFGPDDSARNPAPTWIFVWFWVGLPLVSMFLGPFWRRLNPLRPIAMVSRRVLVALGVGPGERAYPASWGYWPAAASLLAFVWLELAYKGASQPSVLIVFVVAYSLIHVVGGVRYGAAWFARADGFEVYSDIMGRLAPIGRRADDRVVLRNPFDGLASLRPRPGLVAVVCVLLGSTAFDGITRMPGWASLAERVPEQPGNALLGTAGLLAAIGLVAAIYLAATRGRKELAAKILDRTGVGPAGLFVHSLVPIVLGYTIAHYFSFFVFQGQAGYILASDPFGLGWNLLGTAGQQIDYQMVSTMTIGVVQVGVIVLGHVAGVVAAHDRALEVFPAREQLRGQYSLVAAMVVLTGGGIGLLVGSG